MRRELIGKVFEIGQGFVQLVDVMGDELAVIEAARVSYGEGTRAVSDDETLRRYLFRHRHTTPFEMVELKFRVKVPMDTWRQWVRHRTASINEYSTRYSVAIDDAACTGAHEWRRQSATNKQGSDGEVATWPEGYEIAEYLDERGQTRYAVGEMEDFLHRPSPGEYLTARENEFQRDARHVYEERLQFGVAREQARKDLPLSTYTMAYWKLNLHNCLHFLALRMEDHAQLEIREYANVIGYEILAKLFPSIWQAFLDYQFYAITLSRQEVEGLRGLLAAHHADLKAVNLQHTLSKQSLMRVSADTFAGGRERNEAVTKWTRVLALDGVDA